MKMTIEKEIRKYESYLPAEVVQECHRFASMMKDLKPETDYLFHYYGLIKKEFISYAKKMKNLERIRFYEGRLPEKIIAEFKIQSQVIRDLHSEEEADAFYCNLLESRYILIKEKERGLNSD